MCASATPAVTPAPRRSAGEKVDKGASKLGEKIEEGGKKLQDKAHGD
jgi:hypothetical protein